MCETMLTMLDHHLNLIKGGSGLITDFVIELDPRFSEHNDGYYWIKVYHNSSLGKIMIRQDWVKNYDENCGVNLYYVAKYIAEKIEKIIIRQIFKIHDPEIFINDEIEKEEKRIEELINYIERTK